MASVFDAEGWLHRHEHSTTPLAKPKTKPTAHVVSPQSNVQLLFVSGDRSQVGKSSCCLGILSSLVAHGYKPDELAYIKPATQCEVEQDVVKFCEAKGIDAIGIGPVVYYSGFTRQFLDGLAKTSEQMLEDIRKSVNELAKASPTRKLVVVDGVGYPAVGSIVGVSNAEVARVLKAPVILVCPKGVGNAVDSFNLNEAFFAYNGCHVLGGVFNRLPLEGYYSLDKCEDAVSSYFQQYRKDKHIYGFIPEAGEGVEIAGFIVEQFPERFDVVQLLNDINAFYKEGKNSSVVLYNKRKRLSDGASTRQVLSREEVVNRAKKQGASGG